MLPRMFGSDDRIGVDVFRLMHCSPQAVQALDKLIVDEELKLFARWNRLCSD
jgi:hypothetical protein